MTPKKRVILEILFDENYICISRNFRLQRMGTTEWFFEVFDLKELTHHVDEFVLLNVSRDRNYKADFESFVKQVSRSNFAPVTIGGGIQDINDAKNLLKIGADKIQVNSLFFQDEVTLKKFKEEFGQQFIIASIDYREINKLICLFSTNGSVQVGDLNMELIQKINSFAGEVLFRSIDRDGTGVGLDMNLMNHEVIGKLEIPIILAGGAGKPSHILQAIKNSKVSAVATSNLINFLGEGFVQTRNLLISEKVPLPKLISWDSI